jgi:hypothetical protein
MIAKRYKGFNEITRRPRKIARLLSVLTENLHNYGGNNEATRESSGFEPAAQARGNLLRVPCLRSLMLRADDSVQESLKALVLPTVAYVRLTQSITHVGKTAQLQNLRCGLRSILQKERAAIVISSSARNQANLPSWWKHFQYPNVANITPCTNESRCQTVPLVRAGNPLAAPCHTSSHTANGSSSAASSNSSSTSSSGAS